MNALYRIRDWVGLPPALLVLLFLVTIPARQLMGRLPGGQFEVNIEAPAPLPAPSKPEPASATEAPPARMPIPKEPTSHRMRSAAPPAAPASPSSIEALDPSALLPPAEPARALSTAAPSAPAVSPTAPQVERSLSVEEAYIAQIRANVQSRKKYPTGREASVQKPSGTVRACMDLDRAGNAINEIVIERTSHSMILDAEARKLLRIGAYPPFPAGAFPGESAHRFCIQLDYAFQSSG